MIEQLGKRLKQLREAHGYSGTYVGDEIGYSPNTLWQVEKGATKANIEFIANICTFYGIPIDVLVFGSDADFQEHIDKIEGMDEALSQSLERIGYGRANTRWHKRGESDANVLHAN